MDYVDGKLYESFVSKHMDATFFQSWVFGEFQEKIPYRGKTWALIVIANNDIKATCLVIKQKLPFGFSWLWVPYGPLGFSEEIFADLARIAKEESAIFARIEPPLHWKNEYTEVLKKSWRIMPSKKRYTPEHTLILDIEKSEDEILAQMKPKGRYNIGVAQKHRVTIHQWRGDQKEFDAFYEILKKTAVRDNFGVHPKFFYEELLKTLGPMGMATLFLAYAPGVIAGIIVVFYKDTATYYYGASDHTYRHLMAPYLLQWEAIREAKRRGIKHYDFLGIAPVNEKNHPWAGVTEFKKKFGGKPLVYPAAFDIMYKPFWYKAFLIKNSIIETQRYWRY